MSQENAEVSPRERACTRSGVRSAPRGTQTLEELIMAEQSVELVKGIYAAFATGDVPGVLGAFSEDIEWYEAEGMPYGGLHRGGDAVAEKVFGPIAEDVDNFAVTPEEFMASGESVAV